MEVRVENEQNFPARFVGFSHHTLLMPSRLTRTFWQREERKRILISKYTAEKKWNKESFTPHRRWRRRSLIYHSRSDSLELLEAAKMTLMMMITKHNHPHSQLFRPFHVTIVLCALFHTPTNFRRIKDSTVSANSVNELAERMNSVENICQFAFAFANEKVSSFFLFNALSLFLFTNILFWTFNYICEDFFHSCAAGAKIFLAQSLQAQLVPRIHLECLSSNLLRWLFYELEWVRLDIVNSRRQFSVLCQETVLTFSDLLNVCNSTLAGTPSIWE